MPRDNQAIALSLVEMKMILLSLGIQRKLNAHNRSLPINLRPNEDE
jgi:hypothetical protein